jgi:hypothetical protein
MGSSILLLERKPCGLCYNTHRLKCAIRSHHSLTRFDNIKQTLSKLHATQVELKHLDRYGRRFPRGNDSANPYEALWGRCGPGSRGPVRGGKQYGPSNRGDGEQRNDAIIAERNCIEWSLRAAKDNLENTRRRTWVKPRVLCSHRMAICATRFGRSWVSQRRSSFCPG